MSVRRVGIGSTQAETTARWSISTLLSLINTINKRKWTTAA